MPCMIKSILEETGHKVGLIGTIEAIIGDLGEEVGDNSGQGHPRIVLLKMAETL